MRLTSRSRAAGVVLYDDTALPRILEEEEVRKVLAPGLLMLEEKFGEVREKLRQWPELLSFSLGMHGFLPEGEDRFRVVLDVRYAPGRSLASWRSLSARRPFSWGRPRLASWSG